MMIGLYKKKGDNRSDACLKEFQGLLKNENIGFISLTEEEDDSVISSLRFIVVFGGDGTVLRAAKFARDKIPLIAVNSGTLGFLTSYEYGDIKRLVSDVLNESLSFTEREFLKVSVRNKNFLALNDAVVLKNRNVDDYDQCVKLNFSIDGEYVDGYIGDGLIISTPTGSTAYAISAGGPIILPSIKACVAAPICAHSLRSRPIVYPMDSVAEIKINDLSPPCVLYVDGKKEAELSAGDAVKITRSNKFAKICNNGGEFFSRLSDKLNKWSINDISEVEHG